MVQGGTTTVAVVASLSWLALVLVGLVHVAGGELPSGVELLGAVVAAPIALTGGIQAIAAIWRGPVIVPFSRLDAVPCTAGEASFVRASAQLRGTMGGAGHLYRHRLVLPALAWLGAASVGAGGLSERLEHLVCPWVLVLALASAFLALLFPARPFFYRETSDGGALASPPSAAYRLKRRSEIAAALARGEKVAATTPPPTPARGVPVAVPEVGRPRDGA